MEKLGKATLTIKEKRKIKKKITNQELFVYLNENISVKTTELVREQNPELIFGKPNKVLMVYK